MKGSKETVGELSPAKQKLYELLKARQRAEEETAEAVTINPVDRSGSLPLSFSQQRMWFVDYLEPGNPAYNVPGALRLAGDL
ncbi:MAG: hypothetical protein GY856_04195, partial [bacterium]|nr:hypothetical protein [bacterium]